MAPDAFNSEIRALSNPQRASVSSVCAPYTGGPCFTLDGVRVEPKPVKRHVDVWLGGAAPAELRRCGRLGDGWLPSFATPAAVERGIAMRDEGATLVDVGGESTRPGAEPVAEDEELRRVVPVLEGLRERAPGATLSIDTSKLEVARAAIDAGATYVNDVTALRHDPEIAGLVAETGADCCLMHMQGEPRTMQADPRYDDVVDDVRAFLHCRCGRDL